MPASLKGANVNIQRNISFNQSYFKSAVRKTNIRSRDTFRQLRKMQLDLTPQDLGNVAKRSSIKENSGKSPQSRFIDMLS
ncbi:MAG: hypothetical protein GY863_16435 [bacterium]|nr:hypothetical protein [bacterium]